MTDTIEGPSRVEALADDYTEFLGTWMDKQFAKLPPGAETMARTGALMIALSRQMARTVGIFAANTGLDKEAASDLAGRLFEGNYDKVEAVLQGEGETVQ